MRRYFIIPMLIITLASISGCATVMRGKYQSVMVETYPAGASCTLYNDQGSWYIFNTPTAAVVKRSMEDLNVACDKPGYAITADSFRAEPVRFSNGTMKAKYPDPIMIMLTQEGAHYRGHQYGHPNRQYNRGYDARTAKY